MKYRNLVGLLLMLVFAVAAFSQDDDETEPPDHIQRALEFIKSDGIGSYKITPDGHLIFAIELQNGEAQPINVRPEVYEMNGDDYIEIWSQSSTLEKDVSPDILKMILMDANDRLFPSWKILPYDEQFDLLCAYMTLREDVERQDFLIFSGVTLGAANDMKHKLANHGIAGATGEEPDTDL